MNAPRRLLPIIERWAAMLVRQRPPATRGRRSILVLKLDAIGDFILAIPFLRELRLGDTDAHITLCTGPAASPLARHCPYVDDHQVFDVGRGPKRFGVIRRVFEYRRQLRRLFHKRPFDHVLIPRTGPDLQHAHLLAFLTGAPIRLGFGTAGGNYLTTSFPRPGRDVHEVHANLSLLPAMGIFPRSDMLQLWPSPSEECALDSLMTEERVLNASRLIIFGVGASMPHKVWPPERFESLARILGEKYDAHVIAIGDAGDAARHPPSVGRWHNWAGHLTLTEACRLLRDADFFVGNDSAGVHLAAAAQCPVVVISWDHAANQGDDVNSYVRFAPYQVPHRTVHPPAHAVRSVKSISVEVVADAVHDLVNALPPKPVAP